MRRSWCRHTLRRKSLTDADGGISAEMPGDDMIAEYGFVRCAAVSPRLKVADVDFNVDQMLGLLSKAEQSHVSLLCFPELGITSYTCGDLFLQSKLQKAAEEGLGRIIAADSPVTCVAGLPVKLGTGLYNCAAVVSGGRLLGVVPKMHIPNYNEYYERRWFVPASGDCPETAELCGTVVPFGPGLVFCGKSAAGPVKFGVEICEDLWVPNPPSGTMAQAGAHIICNPSASTELATKHDYRRSLAVQQSGRCISGYVYASANHDESTTDVVFGGWCAVCENGTVLNENKRFTRDSEMVIADIDVGRLDFHRLRNTTFQMQGNGARTIEFAMDCAGGERLMRPVTPHPFVPAGGAAIPRLEEITMIQTAALTKRLEHIGTKKVVLGISGGLDSTLALLVAARAFGMNGWDPKGIIAVTMPGFGTGDRTLANALKLMEGLGCDARRIDITAAVSLHFRDIGHDEELYDLTYENSQARERTQILMDLATKEGAIALGTGDLSELALGWATYNGDHMSMYNVNCSVPKTLVKSLVHYLGHDVFGGKIAATIDDILDTPISPELVPSEPGGMSQRTEDILGKYDLHDFFLYHMLEGGASPKKLYMLARHAFAGIADHEAILSALKTFLTRFFSQQFKRSCLPDGPKVGTVSLSPRGDWRMPSDASGALWIRELEDLEP